jgi:hypothetical protein
MAQDIWYHTMNGSLFGKSGAHILVLVFSCVQIIEKIPDNTHIAFRNFRLSLFNSDFNL